MKLRYTGYTGATNADVGKVVPGGIYTVEKKLGEALIEAESDLWEEVKTGKKEADQKKEGD